MISPNRINQLILGIGNIKTMMRKEQRNNKMNNTRVIFLLNCLLLIIIDVLNLIDF